MTDNSTTTPASAQPAPVDWVARDIERLRADWQASRTNTPERHLLGCDVCGSTSHTSWQHRHTDWWMTAEERQQERSGQPPKPAGWISARHLFFIEDIPLRVLAGVLVKAAAEQNAFWRFEFLETELGLLVKASSVMERTDLFLEWLRRQLGFPPYGWGWVSRLTDCWQLSSTGSEYTRHYEFLAHSR